MNWILQCNPEIYLDIWNVYEYREPMENWDVGLRWTPRLGAMRQGDPAAIWICGPDDAGVYGLTSIDGRGGWPQFQMMPIENGWHPDYIGQWRCWVGLGQTHWLDRPILRTTLKADRRFAGARIIRQPWAANPFLTTDEEWRAITSRRRSNRAR